MATSKDVAAKAGVSHTTVSRAFRGDVRVNPETYEKIMEAARTLNYTPNMLASGLKKKHSNTVGLINSDINNPFFMIIAKRLEDFLNRRGYRLIISFDAYDFHKQENALRTMSASQAEAIIFTPVAGEYPLDGICGDDVRLIQLFNKLYRKLPSIRFDDRHGAYVGAKHLLQNGHRNILLLGGSDRIQGYIDAFDEYSETPLLFNDISGGDEERLKNAICGYIESTHPTAVLAVGDRYARCAFEAFKRLKLRISDDISFLVYDDINWTQMMDISAVSHPIDQLTEAVCNMIFALLEGENEVEDRMFDPFLIKRKSIKNIEK